MCIIADDRMLCSVSRACFSMQGKRMIYFLSLADIFCMQLHYSFTSPICYGQHKFKMTRIFNVDIICQF